MANEVTVVVQPAYVSLPVEGLDKVILGPLEVNSMTIKSAAHVVLRPTNTLDSDAVIVAP